MKNYTCYIILALILIMILFGIDTSSRCKEVEVQLQTERFRSEQSISQLEKEIRILKQDMLILQNEYKEK